MPQNLTEAQAALLSPLKLSQDIQSLQSQIATLQQTVNGKVSSKVAQNIAQNVVASAASSSSSSSSSSASTASTPTWHVLGTPISLYNGSSIGTLAWFTQVLAGIPSNATLVMLNGYARQSSKGDNLDQELDFRMNGSSPTIYGAKLRSVNGTYSNLQAIFAIVPCSSGSIQLQITSGGFDALLLQVIGYFA